MLKNRVEDYDLLFKYVQEELGCAAGAISCQNDSF
jgi:hypothetical protein